MDSLSDKQDDMKSYADLTDMVGDAAGIIPERRAAGAAEVLARVTEIWAWINFFEYGEQRERIRKALDSGQFPFMGLALYTEEDPIGGRNRSAALTQFDFFIGEQGRVYNPCRFGSPDGMESEMMLLPGHNCADWKQFPW